MPAENQVHFEQSAVIPFRMNKNIPEILLITSQSGKRWIIPKGFVEPNLSPAESAVKEAYEEAGVKGTVYSKRLGSYDYEKWGGICSVVVFPMKVEQELQNWPERMWRERKWVTIKQASDILDDRVPREILQALEKLLNKKLDKSAK